MGAIEIKKLSIDYAYSIEKSKDDPPCKHFSIRSYVAGKREKDWKMCSPFPINEFEGQPSLPPLVVSRFKAWSCHICRGQNECNVKVLCNMEEIDEATSTDMTAKEMEVADIMDLSLVPDVENEIDEAMSEDTSAEDMELGSMKSNLDLTTEGEESDQDLLMEVAEIMTMSLPDMDKVNCGVRNSSQNDKTTGVAEVLNEQDNERDFDLNIPYSADTEQEMLSGYIDLNIPYCPGEGSTKLDIDLNIPYSPEGQLPDSHRKSYFSDKLIGPSDLGDRNITVSGKEKMSSSRSFMQNRKKLFGWLDLEEEEEEKETPPQHCGARETPMPLNHTSERFCRMNTNSSKFTPVEAGNPYTVNEEDKVEKRVCKKRCGSSPKQKRNSKKR